MFTAHALPYQPEDVPGARVLRCRTTEFCFALIDIMPLV
jgi:hypothetical protein